MKETIQATLQRLEAGQPAELVSVLDSTGSTPRGAGAVMAVFLDGTACGTVGGGNVEFEAVKLAGKLLENGESALRQFRFIQGHAASLGMVCGGDVTLHFQYITPEQTSLFRQIGAAVEEGRSLWLARKLEEEQVTEMLLADRSGSCGKATVPAELLQNRAVSSDGWFVLPVTRAGKVYIFGGGHVSQALVPAIAAVDFRPVVFDDRAEFAKAELFPDAEAVLCGSFEDVTRYVDITPEDYVVIMTRGHQADYEVLTQTLRSGAKYLGCIGSRRKLAFCKEQLLADGFAEEEYARLHAPIGLAIGAETPAEIAVSVTAELIAVRAGVIL